VEHENWGKSFYRPVTIWHSRLSPRIGDINNIITNQGVLQNANFQGVNSDERFI
jgi:hypothetical protein